ncbi:hypothetical protein BU17DRAFT_82342 [Hysterangium stoloniferum]|nr:hypothetical protein BU17DRAFT_82342 [Hysterangium stoloniferum]
MNRHSQHYPHYPPRSSHPQRVPTQSASNSGILPLAGEASGNVDIVAIHGAGGHRERSWTAKGSSQTWLGHKDMLPRNIRNARILTYGYNTAWDEKQSYYDAMKKQARGLIADVMEYRKITTTPPNRRIIFIAHSTGGIVLKFALILANDPCANLSEDYQSFARATAGILFLGTPHQGTETPSRLVNLYFTNRRPNTSLTRDFMTHWNKLQKRLLPYNRISDNYITKFYFEGHPTSLPDGSRDVLVPRWSAVVQGAVNAEAVMLNKNHSDLAKFKSYEDNDYLSIVNGIEFIISHR